MIQINDYRIGNFILVDRVLRSICLINADLGFEGAPYVGFAGPDEHPYESCASPRLQSVPLSEKVLYEVDFRESPRLRLEPVADGGGAYQLELEGGAPLLPTRPLLRRTVRYLHEVQNLYHAVYGQELRLSQRVFAGTGTAL